MRRTRFYSKIRGLTVFSEESERPRLKNYVQICSRGYQSKGVCQGYRLLSGETAIVSAIMRWER